jgi:membrane protein involved in colicin uptake
MPRVLKDIKINEVSGVDRGAGEGVRVVFMKRRDNQQQEIDMTPEQIATLVADGIKKAMETALPAAVTAATADMAKAAAAAQAEITLLKMSDAEKAFCDKKGWDDTQRKAFAAKPDADRAADMAKAASEGKLPAEIAKALTDANAEIAKRDTLIADLKKRADAADEKDAIVTFGKRAVAAGLKEADGEIMRKAYAGDAAAQTELDKKFTELTKALTAAQETGNIFKTFGSDGGEGGGATAHEQFIAKATELRKSEPKLSPEQAYSKVYTDPANAALSIQHRREEALRKSHIVAA